jgi:hypothetical protein
MVPRFPQNAAHIPVPSWRVLRSSGAATNNVEFRNEDTDFTLTNTILLTVKITVQTSNL